MSTNLYLVRKDLLSFMWVVSGPCGKVAECDTRDDADLVAACLNACDVFEPARVRALVDAAAETARCFYVACSATTTKDRRQSSGSYERARMLLCRAARALLACGGEA